MKIDRAYTTSVTFGNDERQMLITTVFHDYGLEAMCPVRNNFVLVYGQIRSGV